MLSCNKYTGQSLIRRPRHKIFLRGIYTYDKGEIIGEGEIIGKRLDLQPPSYLKKVEKGLDYKVTLKLNYHLSSQWTVYGRIENLLNRKIEDPLGYWQAGIAGYVGLKTSF